jgi:LPXTG-site transpeptidase (sortase) family protein
LTKSFTNATIPAGGNSRLRLSIIAPADTALTNFSITDNLPAGVTVSNSTPPAFSAGCGAAGNRTLNAPNGATSINLLLNSFAANATCNLDVWVTSSTPGTVTNTVTPANITNTQGRTITANATANLSVTTLTVSKAFFPPTVNPNGLSTLTITLVNTNSSPLVSVSLLDPLPGSAANGIRIATPPNASTDCGGTLTAAANTQNIQLTGGTIPAQVGGVPGQCTIVVNVIGRGVTATYTNTIPTTNVIGTIQGTATTLRPLANATANIRVQPIGIQVVKGFNPLTVFGGASSVLSVQLINPNNSALSGITFTDNMPAGMIIANPPNFNTGSCSGTLTGVVGSGTFVFSGGVLPAASSCTLTLNATMTVNGNLTNTIVAGAVTTFNGATNAQPASATLTNLPGASVSKAFAPNPIYAGQYSLLTITIQNTGNIALTGMGLIDNLPAGTAIAGIPAPPAVNNCGGSLTATPGTQLIQLIGGGLPGSSSCTLVIPVTSNVANNYLNTIPAGRLTSTEGATNQDPTNDTLRVLARASLGDFVWNDTNANGIQDAGEPGIDGVSVELFNGLGVSQGTTTTAGGGFYSFTDLIPGDYYLDFTAPVGFVFSPQNAGGDDTVDSDADPTTGTTATTTLVSGENDLTWDAGLYQLASLGDFVWNDTNANGIQDAGEPGIENVTVNLLDSGGSTIDTTTTNATGFYQFTGLIPGTYSVQFVAPSGFSFSPQNAGSDDALDSDADTTTGITGSYTLTSGQYNDTVDAGLYQPTISVDKSVSSITFLNPTLLRMTYTITIGPEPIPLDDIQATDDLTAAFPSLPFSVISVNTTPNLTVNPLYDGDTDTNLLTGTDDFAVAETGTITLNVEVSVPNQTDTYTNTVYASGLPPTGPRVVASDTVVGPLFADPAVTKSGDPSRVFVGEIVTFTITVSNEGNQTATDVNVTDILPDNMTVVSATSTRGTVTITPPRTVEVDLGDLDPNVVVTIIVAARVNSTGSPPIINSVELTTTSPTDQDPNNRDSVIIEVLQPVLPETGFAPSRLTRIPAQPSSIVYSTNDELSLSIPSLKISLPIVGVPKSGDSWDVTWLGNRAGWLNGTSYPTWSGNSVITGHVYLSNGLAGPFLNIGKLNYGERVIVHAYGKDYTYEVRSVRTIKPWEVASVMRHEDRSWVTLLTCKGFNEDSGNYDLRTVVRAVLVSVK